MKKKKKSVLWQAVLTYPDSFAAVALKISSKIQEENTQ